MDPSEEGGRRAGEPSAPPAPRRDDVGGEASERQQEIGPSGGPPSDEERQSRGSTPTERVLEPKLREGEGAPLGPAGTQGGESAELGEPDPGVIDPAESTD